MDRFDLIQVTTWAGLTVFVFSIRIRFYRKPYVFNHNLLEYQFVIGFS
jgi:hypothetical protein